MKREIKMKTARPLFVVLLLAILAYLAYFIFTQWLYFSGDPLTQARAMYPLGKDYAYVIVKTDSSGATVEKDVPYVYAIITTDEPKSSAGLSWRRIGKTNINLEPYLNKPVYINGRYYMGTPMLLNEVKHDNYGLLMTQPVIEIDNLTLIK